MYIGPLSSPNVPEPAISCIRRVVAYETRNKLLIIGCNRSETKFRVLQVDRSEPKDLVVIDDKHEYTKTDVHNILSCYNKKGSSSNLKSTAGYGILGFVRLTEGYYLILITRRRHVAQIGHHMIYKVDETAMVYIPNTGTKQTSDEKKYLKIFQNVDLSSNFYFSYSYDLTRTLQYNLAPFSQVSFVNGDDDIPFFRQVSLIESEADGKFLRRTKPCMKFVWNEHLWDLKVDFHPDWRIHVIHGFVSQTNISIYGQAIYLTLIARRSKKYAGTRFLKRGSNMSGDVANEVETEQIVHDSSVSALKLGRFTSFVQMRGSVPGYWKQDVSKMVPKPLIMLNNSDPFFKAAGLHFNNLLAHYGSPLIALNLVKSRERKPHETVLTNEFYTAISYLNQFLPPQHQIELISYDMAYVNKTKDDCVMAKLSDIAFRCISKTGIFRSHNLGCGGSYQTGVVRVNCVDCLDRTNTAAFALGKAALGIQLQSLGLIASPHLEFDTDTIRMLEEVYEDHGDTLALQYGGSQLVHRIKTYRKIAPLSSHSRDIMQTLSRYYRNTFSDADKQNAINVFLGMFKPYERPDNLHIWDLQTDFYLHNPQLKYTKKNKVDDIKPLTCWWDEDVVSCLPLPSEQIFKSLPDNILYSIPADVEDEAVDGYSHHYKYSENVNLQNELAFQMLHTAKDFMPTSSTDFSPFKYRGKNNKRKEPPVPPTSISYKIPLLTETFSILAMSSHSSPSPSEADSDEFFGEPEHLDIRCDIRSNSVMIESDSLASLNAEQEPKTFYSILPKSEQIYGSSIDPKVSSVDLDLYKSYIEFGQTAGEFTKPLVVGSPQQPKSLTSIIETNDSFFEVKNSSSDLSFIFQEMDIFTRKNYEDHIAKKEQPHKVKPNQDDLNLYKTYVTKASFG